MTQESDCVLAFCLASPAVCVINGSASPRCAVTMERYNYSFKAQGAIKYL